MSRGGGGREDGGLPSGGLVGGGDSVADTRTTGVSQNTSHPLPLRKGESQDGGGGGVATWHYPVIH